MADDSWQIDLGASIDLAIDQALGDIDDRARKLGLSTAQVYAWMLRSYGFDWADAWAEYTAKDLESSGRIEVSPED